MTLDRADQDQTSADRLADEHEQLLEAALAMAATIRVELLHPGDVAVFRFGVEVSREWQQRLNAQLRAALGDQIPVLVLDTTVELQVLRQAAAERLAEITASYAASDKRRHAYVNRLLTMPAGDESAPA